MHMASKRGGPRGEDRGEFADVFELEETPVGGRRRFDVLGGPRDAVRYVNARASEGQNGEDVGFEGIADHQKTLWVDRVPAEERRVRRRVFFG